MQIRILSLILLGTLTVLGQEPAPSMPKTANLDHFVQRIRDKASNYKASGSIVIAAFGDSITMGATAGGVLEPDNVYHSQLKKLLEQRFPQDIFSVINSGIGGDNAPMGLARIERDVIRYQPDLVVVAFGTNDAGGSPQAYENGLRGIVKSLHEKSPQTDIILLTPPFLASRDNGQIPAGQQEMLKNLIQHQTDGTVKKFADIVKKVGAEEGVTVADLYGEWEKLAASGKDTTAMLANGLNHPNAEGHKMEADLLMKTISDAFVAYRPAPVKAP